MSAWEGQAEGVASHEDKPLCMSQREILQGMQYHLECMVCRVNACTRLDLFMPMAEKVEGLACGCDVGDWQPVPVEPLTAIHGQRPEAEPPCRLNAAPVCGQVWHQVRPVVHEDILCQACMPAIFQTLPSADIPKLRHPNTNTMTVLTVMLWLYHRAGSVSHGQSWPGMMTIAGKCNLHSPHSFLDGQIPPRCREVKAS